MPIASTDIVAYGSADMQDTDTGAQGGAIDLTKRVVFTDISAADTVEILSDAAGDTTQQMTITGRDAAGNIVSETKTLTGTTPVTTTQSFERILKMVLDNAAAGSVTVRKQSDNAEIAVFEPGLLEIRRAFYNAAADAAGGAAKTYYEKFFFKNNHASLDLTNAVVSEEADPSGKITFALDSALDGTTSAADRQTAPASGISAFNNTAKNVANSQSLTHGTAQGVWLKLDLAAGDAAAKTTWTGRMTGNTV